MPTWRLSFNEAAFRRRVLGRTLLKGARGEEAVTEVAIG